MEKHARTVRAADGFTLVELLVVVAIIGMLCALLMPAIGGAAQKAKSAKCLGSLRQVGIAVQQYLADPDNGNRFPPVYNSGATNDAVGSFTTNATPSLQPLVCLSNYGVTMALLTCPSDPLPDAVYGSYIWSPVLQGELPHDIRIYTRGGVFTVNKLASMTVCTDKGLPHMGKLNVLRADGHVDSRP